MKTMDRPYIIVWDLDLTLGEFSALEGDAHFDEEVVVRMRPGLKDALHRLRCEGFVHCLLSMANRRYAELALRGTGLRSYFDHVDGHGQRLKGDAEGIASEYGMSLAQAADRMIFVGDRLIFDEPKSKDVVFHLEPAALHRPAELFRQLVLLLRSKGKGSIREGMRSILRTRRPWYSFRSLPPAEPGKPVIHRIPGLGEIVTLEREEGCPIIGFETPPNRDHPPDEHRFVPSRILDPDPQEYDSD